MGEDTNDKIKIMDIQWKNGFTLFLLFYIYLIFGNSSIFLDLKFLSSLYCSK